MSYSYSFASSNSSGLLFMIVDKSLSKYALREASSSLVSFFESFSSGKEGKEKGEKHHKQYAWNNVYIVNNVKRSI